MKKTKIVSFFVKYRFNHFQSDEGCEFSNTSYNQYLIFAN